jgi:hypothetical protein
MFEEPSPKLVRPKKTSDISDALFNQNQESLRKTYDTARKPLKPTGQAEPGIVDFASQSLRAGVVFYVGLPLTACILAWASGVSPIRFPNIFER